MTCGRKKFKIILILILIITNSIILPSINIVYCAENFSEDFESYEPKEYINSSSLTNNIELINNAKFKPGIGFPR